MTQLSLSSLYVMYAAVTGRNVPGDLTTSAALQALREAGTTTRMLADNNTLAADAYVRFGKVRLSKFDGETFVAVTRAAVDLCQKHPDALPYNHSIRVAANTIWYNTMDYPLDDAMVSACYERIAYFDRLEKAEVYVGLEREGCVEYCIRVSYEGGGGMTIGALRRAPDAEIEFHS